jgi:hypothetical protein
MMTLESRVTRKRPARFGGGYGEKARQRDLASCLPGRYLYYLPRVWAPYDPTSGSSPSRRASPPPP